MKNLTRVVAVVCFATQLGWAAPAEIKVAGDWEVRVAAEGVTASLTIQPPKIITITAEKIAPMPRFDAKSSGWRKGARLKGVISQETCATGMLEADSLVLRAGPEASADAFAKGKDYELDALWGSVGRLTNGAIGATQPVYASYRHTWQRIDSIVRTPQGKLVVRAGEPRVSGSVPPALSAGERLLANVWLPGLMPRLTGDHLFPVLEAAYPEPPKPSPTLAEQRLPKTMQKLKNGEALRVLAWGDSVTVGTFVPEPDKNRWQAQFVARLQARYPEAKIELITEAWGGRNTGSYLAEPPGSEHNYREKVLGAKPDLVVMEFVNDASFNPQQVEERYSKLLADIQGIGAEWLILTPHYVRPDWMKLTSEKNLDEDPRPYVTGVRQFTAKHGVALADASLRWGRLWRQGIPYTSLLLNSINHPDERGMKIFADALMEIFP